KKKKKKAKKAPLKKAAKAVPKKAPKKAPKKKAAKYRYVYRSAPTFVEISAMSSIVPNKSLVEGKIISMHKSANIDNFSVMEIQPLRISPVEGSVHLLHSGQDTDSPSGEQTNLHIHVSDEISQQHDLRP